MQTMPTSGARKNSQLRKPQPPWLLILASDSHRPVDLSARLAAQVLELLGRGGILGGRQRFRQLNQRTLARRISGRIAEPKIENIEPILMILPPPASFIAG
jgi:hypothetical protein